MRLIDADELIKEVEQGLKGTHHDNSLVEKAHRIEHIHFLSVIARQPTAYDVDKVWNEITDRAGKATTKGAYRTYWECAKIVKGGGVDDN